MSGKSLKSLAWALITAGVLVIIISSIARHFSEAEGMPLSATLDQIYIFMRNHFWEGLATLSLLLGVWFSVIRRRILVSLFFLIFAFLCSFVLPVVF